MHSQQTDNIMKVSYHTYHSFKDKDGNECSTTSQLYMTGIYVIYNNNSALQGSSTPQKIRKLQNKLRKDEQTGVISDLHFGREIMVSNDGGVWKEVVDPKTIFVEQGKTYDCKSSVTGSTYHFTIIDLQVSDERQDCYLTFTSEPKCEELSILKNGDNTFKVNLFSFQDTIIPIS